MDNDVSAGSATTSTLGHLALGLTLLAFGIGTTGVVDNVAADDASALATWVGGVALFVAGLLAFREGDTGSGTAFGALGAFWFTWGMAVGEVGSAEAAGLFALLWALLALSLTAGAARGSFVQGQYGLLTIGLALVGIGTLAESGGVVKAGGWVAVAAGLAAWYGATAALAKWPTFSGRPAGRGVTAAG
ncbi:GPR1/FUN34/YaaH family transporter [Streptomyces sp. NPDC003691]